VVPKSDAYVQYLALEYRWGPTTLDPRYWQSIRKTVVGMLRDHENAVLRPALSVTLPTEVARRLRMGLESLSHGDHVPLFEPHRWAGGKGNLRSKGDQDAIDAAVAYLTAVDLGLITDRRSRTTIAEAYRVTRQQVRRWIVAAANKTRQRAWIEQFMRRLHPLARAPDFPRIIKKLMQIRAGMYRKSRRMQ
jgi:hypothetical protein